MPRAWRPGTRSGPGTPERRLRADEHVAERDCRRDGEPAELAIIGSLVGGLLGCVLFHKDADQGLFQPAGIIGSIIGAVIALLIWQMSQRRSATHV